MQLSVGDKVKLIDEDLEGTVVKLEGRLALIATDDEFDYWKPLDQIIKINDNSMVEFEEVGKMIEFESEDESNSVNPFPIKLDLDAKVPIVDLHIQEIANKLVFSSKHEAFLFQINYLEGVIELAKKKRKRRLIVIHGFGKGKLKSEIQNLLKRSYPEIEYFDASYQKFGNGAIEIIIHGLGRL